MSFSMGMSNVIIMVIIIIIIIISIIICKNISVFVIKGWLFKTIFAWFK